MQDKDGEYKEIFVAEALENYSEINRLLTQIEKRPDDLSSVNALFRITHTLKGNAAGMGFTGIAELSHILEDLFAEVRDGKILLDTQQFATLYKAIDVLGNLINAIKDGTEVKYKGIKTKLEVLLKRSKEISEKATASINRQDDSTISADTTIDPLTSTNPIDLLTEDADDVIQDEETKVSFSDLVQVPVRKLDNLLNLVGELIIEKDRILASQLGNGLNASNEYARLSRISSDLQYSVMDVRLVQVGFLFNKFHRVVRDAAAIEHKNVVLKLIGTDTEIDRNVLQVISDSLIHLIRNCVGHGIEQADERVANGKPAEGTIWLGARIDTDAVIVEIRDDGKGLDFERIKKKALTQGLIKAEEADKLSQDELSLLIFEPGFSTMDNVNAISGRGVGMDVVKRTMNSIGGIIKIASEPGQGTTVQLTLPSSMAVKSCLLLELSNETYAIPLAYTESVISLYKANIHKAGGGLVATHLGKNIAIVFLKDVFDQQADRSAIHTNLLQSSFDQIHPEEKLDIVVVSFSNRVVGFVVDKLLQQKEIVEKPLVKPVDKIKFISGVTILGSGNVCLVLNVPHLLNFIFSLTANGKVSKNFTLN